MVQPGLSGTRLLENLPQRPPTPPRESDHNVPQADISLLQRVFDHDIGAHTPPQHSPVSSVESSARTANKSQKKVVWSAWTTYEEAPHKGSTPPNKLRPVPPSGELKPAKSILKPYNGVNPVQQRNGPNRLAAPHTYPDFATMLESIVRQLAGEDRSSRIDAYLTLSGVLKASDNAPEFKALREKISLLTQFIQRDMSARTASGTPDTVLVNNSLILLVSLLWKPTIADCLTTEFCTYVIEHSISSFKDPQASKDIVKHLLHVLGQPRFPQRILTPDRARRLIEALVDIENHMKGKSIILGRVTIYRKLLKQVRTAMLATTGWMENLFMDMTSSTREIRPLAIEFGFEAALVLGSEKQTSRAFMELFRKEHGDTNYTSFYARRLNSMVLNKQDGDLVPQIWSIVVLFLRCRPHQLEHWEFITPWLQVIEKCFNSSDHDIKMQANLAWNRLVFAVCPDESTSPTMRKMLSKVLDLQLRRKQTGKYGKEAKQVTLGSICNLLYYALRPNAPFAQFDLYWEEYVVNLIGNVLISRSHEKSEMEQEDLGKACEILGALLDISPKAWAEGRASENVLMKADELPSIDPKWVRKNALRVFKVLGPLLEKLFQDPTRWESSIQLIWSRFISSVTAAGAKEVKVSNDTMSSVACILTLLYKLWDISQRTLQDEVESDRIVFQRIFSYLVTSATKSLGVLPFTEKLLAIGPQESFAIVSTPSQNPSKHRADARSPFHHLFDLMTRPAPSIGCHESYLETVKGMLSIFYDARKSRRSRIELSRDLSQLLPLTGSDSRVSIVLWRVLASYIITALDSEVASVSSSTSSGSHDQPLGVEYRNVIRVLELGLRLSPDEPIQDWIGLFMTVVSRITIEAGESGCAISVIEPLARTIVERLSAPEQYTSLKYGSILVSNAPYPRDLQALHAAKRRLWGVPTIGTKLSTSDPYKYLYCCVNRFLQIAYMSSAHNQLDDHLKILSNAVELIQRSNPQHVHTLMAACQDGFGRWIQDEDLKFGARRSPAFLDSVITLWETICSAMVSLPPFNTDLLLSLEFILCSAFKSSHKQVVNVAIHFWNGTFGKNLTLEYPAGMKEVLFSLREVTNISIPSLTESLAEEVTTTGPTPVDESQEDIFPYNSRDYHVSTSPSSEGGHSFLDTSPLPRLRKQESPCIRAEITLSGSQRRLLRETPESSKWKVTKKNLTPKLRHDNSQIQFAAIDSSPLAGAVVDSQLLTERQREVKERQKEAGVIFMDLESSSKFKTKSGQPKLVLSSDQENAKQSNPPHPNTPTLSIRDKGLIDTYMTSSPTPRRESSGVLLDSDFLGPPSSPPEQVLQDSHWNNVASSISFRADSDVLETTTRATKHDMSDVSTDMAPSAQVVDEYHAAGQDVSFLVNSMSDNTPVSHPERPRTPLEKQGELAREQQAARTPNEIFVDALTSPLPPTPARDINSEEWYSDALSTPLKMTVAPEKAAMAAVQPVLKPNHTQRLDGHNSFSMSETDEDSIIRLITKFDIPAPQPHDADNIAAGHAELESSLLGNGAHNAACGPAVKGTVVPQPLRQPYHQSSDVTNPPPRIYRTEAMPTTTEILVTNSLRASSRLKGITMASSAVPETPLRDSLVSGSMTDSEMSTSQRVDSIINSEEKRTNKRSRRPEDVQEPGGLMTKKMRTSKDSAEFPTGHEEKGHGHVSQPEANDGHKGSHQLTKDESDAAVASLPKADPPSSTDLAARMDDDPCVVGVAHGETSPSGETLNEPVEVCSRHDSGGDGELGDMGVAAESPRGGSDVVGRFEAILTTLRSVALTREEAQRVENLLWDVKGELYAAEKRGREMD